MLSLFPMEDGTTTTPTTGNTGVSTSIDSKNLNDMVSLIKSVISAALGVITAVIIGFAIYLAIKFFTAEDDGKRKNAKQQLIYAIIGIVVMIALMLIAPQITNAIQDAVKK